MRINYIEIAGNKHPICFSLSATEALIDEFGSIEAMTEALDGNNISMQLKAVDIVLSILLDAGRRYCEVMEIDLPPALKGRPADVIDVSDPSAISKIFETMSLDSKRTVEVKQSKKGKPKQE